jgi:hypothetical protein
MRTVLASSQIPAAKRDAMRMAKGKAVTRQLEGRENAAVTKAMNVMSTARNESSLRARESG